MDTEVIHKQDCPLFLRWGNGIDNDHRNTIDDDHRQTIDDHHRHTIDDHDGITSQCRKKIRLRHPDVTTVTTGEDLLSLSTVLCAEEGDDGRCDGVDNSCTIDAIVTPIGAHITNISDCVALIGAEVTTTDTTITNIGDPLTPIGSLLLSINASLSYQTVMTCTCGGLDEVNERRTKSITVSAIHTN